MPVESTHPFILTAHQPVYLPWLGLMHKIALSDMFCLFDDVQYLKKDWMNRNRIKTANGPVWLTVPVLSRDHYHLKCRDVRIHAALPWRRKHWRSILNAYRSAPFFRRYADFFEDLYSKEWTHLADLNQHILRYLLDAFSIKVAWVRASDCSFDGKGSDLVLDMCRRLNADIYVFGALGRTYARVEDFEKAGISVYFQDYRHPSYPQLGGQFSPSMSAIDLLFNHGPASFEILMEGNHSREHLVRAAGVLPLTEAGAGRP
ncbi:MAG: hypothetical protein A3G34_14260 [Candidatus Lindowbacteria bacterium RIFCSPLOWO2_12_FULL_62_27]|nr:MAG: hypothetical protein A3I06_15755 [Candidatus Lindowbacteria bacterium RIFCSPLOWO2_02_FULL_62_12]OGH62728.1 MAG: hypothetical protein A3G34_14260 [Candidatus Lindowbacteria bacterium RIFCSPLOWO2_12_FULL_62_27]